MKGLKGSDDFAKYKDVFAKAASDLIGRGQCKAKGMYFTYCGGMSSQNEVYLNATTGRTQ